MVTAPETVRTEALLKSIVAVVLLPPVVFNDNEEQAALLTFTVTVMPGLIITASAEVGTAEPPHVAVLFQLPETDAVLCANAKALNKMENKSTVAFEHSDGDETFPVRVKKFFMCINFQLGFRGGLLGQPNILNALLNKLLDEIGILFR
jgi:hypothetical protein